MIEGIDADYLIADRGYDTDAILQQAAAQGMHAVIPPKKNRTVQRTYDQDLYKLRHLVENAFLALKQWRGMRPDTPKTPRPSSPPSTSDVSFSGSRSRDYSV